MSNRNNSQDVVNERRIRPLLDHLDSGSNRKAQQEADKLLKKHPNFDWAKVLKALALIRQGYQNESLELILKVHKTHPVDINVLRVMQQCYEELQQDLLVIEAYENAVKKAPYSEVLSTHLFMAYMSQGNYKKMQAVALDLYRTHHKNQLYYFWAVMSLYLQSQNSEDKVMSQRMLLPLAIKMIQMRVNEGCLLTEPELELYLMCLESAQSFDVMKEVLEGKLGHVISDNLGFRSRRLALLQQRLGSLEKAHDDFMQLVKCSPDQLEYYEKLVEISLAKPEHIEKRLESTIDLVNEMEKEHKDKCRAPLLTRLQCWYTLNEKHPNLLLKFSPRLGKSMQDLLISYFSTFGGKPVCMYDLAHLTSKYQFTLDQSTQLAKKLEDSLSERSAFTTVDHMQRWLNVAAFKQSAGIFLNCDEKTLLQEAQELIENYDHSLSFGEDLGKTDFHPADPHCLILFYLLEKAALKNTDLFTALIVALERSLRKSYPNFTHKILLICLYNLAGASDCSARLYELLDVKYIQQDTVGFLLHQATITSCRVQQASQLMNTAQRFYLLNLKETFNNMVTCYKYGSFAKLCEISDVRNKLKYSIQNACSYVQKQWLEMTTCNKGVEFIIQNLLATNRSLTKTAIDWDALLDNRDFMLFRSFAVPEDERLKQCKVNTFQQMRLWLQIKDEAISTLFTLVVILFDSARLPSDIEANSVLIEHVEKLQNNFSNARVEMKKQNAFDLDGIAGGHPVNLKWLISEQTEVIWISLIQFAHNVITQTNSDNVQETLNTAFKQIIEQLSAQADSLNSLAYVHELFANAQQITETIAFATTIIQILLRYLKTDAVKAFKNNKSELNACTSSLQRIKQEVEHIISLFSSAIKKFTVISERITFRNLAPNSSYLFNNKEAEDTFRHIKKKITYSHSQTVNELSELLAQKLKLLQSLKAK